MDIEERIAALEAEVDRLKRAVVELVVNINRVAKVVDSHGVDGPLATIRAEVVAGVR